MSTDPGREQARAWALELLLALDGVGVTRVSSLDGRPTDRMTRGRLAALWAREHS